MKLFRICILLIPLLLSYIIPVLLSAQSLVSYTTCSGVSPRAISVYETGNKLFVADTSDLVLIYDGNTLSLVDTIHTGVRGINQMVFIEKYGKLYAAAYEFMNNGTIAVIDAKTCKLIRHITPNVFQNWFLQLEKDEELGVVYAGCVGGFFRIDAGTDSIKTVGDFSISPNGCFKINPKTHEIFLKTHLGTPVVIIDPYTFDKITEFGGYGYGIGINWKENKAYIPYSNYGAPQYIYNRNTGTIILTNTGNDATILEYNPASNKMFSSYEIMAKITVIDGKTDSSVNIPMGARETFMPFISHSTGHVFYSGSPVTILDGSTLSYTVIDASGDCVAINQLTNKVYVACNDTIKVIQDENDPWPLIQPALLSPVNGQEGISLIDTLRWSATPGAAKYNVEVSRDPDFWSADAAGSGLTDTILPIKMMYWHAGTSFFWRVQAEYQNVKSNFSDSWKFTMIIGPPKLISPAFNETVETINPTFIWHKVKDAASYWLQVSDKYNFSNLVVDQQGIIDTSYTVTSLKYPAAYYWRVCAQNEYGTSAWSDFKVFGLRPTGIAEPLLNNEVKVYPIPAARLLTVEFSQPFIKDAEIKIYDTSGKLILVKKLVSMKGEIDISGFAHGVYYLEIRTGITGYNLKKVIF